MKSKLKNFKSILAVFMGLAVLCPLVWVLISRLEGTEPSMRLEFVSAAIGLSKELSLTVSDTQSGIRRVWVALQKGEKETVLFEKKFPGPGLFGGGRIKEESFKILIEPRTLGISDGKALLRLTARDLSWRRWWHGNHAYLEKEVFIDTRAPEIDVLSRMHNITQGGAGLVVYKLSEACPKSGVFVGDDFFPGHSGLFDDAGIHIALIALAYEHGRGTQMYVQANDNAGNSSRAGFPVYIRRRVFRKDVINISEKFLNWKMPEFKQAISKDAVASLTDQFLWVNRKLRQMNYDQIAELGGFTESSLHWEGAFLRLPKSARKAGFADRREYRYKGRVIDQQVHLGIDLASVERSPVPAANGGKIVFNDYLGIYGKTVIIDHGFGLFSMYSHLSNLSVQKGQTVSKGERIGYTGMTGLAGGDHLHFSMFIHQTFVNPIEWWDATWIKNNITRKVDAVKSRIGDK
ncbi:M23 family metallopeptidase [Thermodesulfobacteriota bacterium]